MTESVADAADARRMTPRTRHEELLFGMWQEVLGQPEMSVEDDFFVLGGNSLHVIRLISRLGEQTGVDFPLQFVHDYPTVAEGAARLDVLAAKSGGVLTEDSVAGEFRRHRDDW
ncbi:phosphopantetheine-binding protein [Streptomyces sp. NPDC048584]|uniref:phosphopantetheine-binding protein n=1 Tax=Streptomyces sp. NPDC048584 TaxID=3365573 RepID=UPI00372136D3